MEIKQTREEQEFWRHTVLSVNPGTAIHNCVILGNLFNYSIQASVASSTKWRENDK